MIVSTKGRYALRVMVELAQHQGDGYVPLNVIAERQDISEKYLESILKVLVQDKLLTGLRGRGGGYRLTKVPVDYTLGEILRWPAQKKENMTVQGKKSVHPILYGRNWII